MSRYRIVLGLLALLALVVFLADLFLLPGTFMPAVVYMAAVLLAAYLIPIPRLVAGIALWTLALQVTSYWLQQPGLSLLPASYIAGLGVVSLLCVVLTQRASREAALRRQAEETAATLQAIQQVTEVAISDLGLDDLLRALLQRLRRVLAADNATILLLTSDGRRLAVRASSGLEEEVEAKVEVPVGQGIAGSIAASREPVIVDDLSQMEVWSPVLRRRVRSLMGVPLFAEGRLIGVVHVDSAEARRFTQADLQLLQLVADRAALVIERARVEAALRENQDRLNRSQEIAHLGSWELDLATDTLTWSDEVYRIFGLRPQQFPASYEAFLEAVYPADRAAVDAAYSGSLREGRDGYEIEHGIVRRDTGEIRCVHEKAEHIRDKDGKIVRSIGMVHDITERKRAEQERERLLAQVEQRSAQLERLQQQRAKHVLGISHGLRTPLTVIQGQAQLLLQALDRAGRNGRLHRGAESIAASAQRMSLTLRDLVDLTSLEGGQPLRLNRVPVELPAFVAELQERLGALLPMDRLKVKVEEGLPEALADPDRLERVLANLLSNAFKFSKPDTEVTLELSKGKEELCVSVADLGVGIPAGQLPHIFDPYQRLQTGPGRGESMGLGLYLAKGLVEAMGGRIWAESEAGKGSTFSFTVALAPAGRVE